MSFYSFLRLCILWVNVYCLLFSAFYGLMPALPYFWIVLWFGLPCWSRSRMEVMFSLHVCMPIVLESIKWKWKLSLHKCKMSQYKIILSIHNVDYLRCLFICSHCLMRVKSMSIERICDYPIGSKKWGICKFPYLLQSRFIVFYISTFYGLMFIICCSLHFECFYGLVSVLELKT